MDIFLIGKKIVQDNKKIIEEAAKDIEELTSHRSIDTERMGDAINKLDVAVNNESASRENELNKQTASINKEFAKFDKVNDIMLNALDSIGGEISDSEVERVLQEARGANKVGEKHDGAYHASELDEKINKLGSGPSSHDSGLSLDE